MWKLIIVLCLVFSVNLSAEIKVLVFAGSTREDSVHSGRASPLPLQEGVGSNAAGCSEVSA